MCTGRRDAPVIGSAYGVVVVAVVGASDGTMEGGNNYYGSRGRSGVAGGVDAQR